MGDRLTQLQDAVDQLAQQFVASIHYINRHHNLETLGPNDQIRDVKQEPDQQEGLYTHHPTTIIFFCLLLLSLLFKSTKLTFVVVVVIFFSQSTRTRQTCSRRRRWSWRRT